MFYKSKKRIAAAILIAAAAEGLAIWSARTEGLQPSFFLVQTLLALGAGLLVMLRFTPSRPVQWGIFILTPAAAFYCLETFTHNPLEMELSPQFMNLLVFWGFYIFMFGLLGNFRRAAYLGSGLTAIIGIANHYTLEFRDNPILPWDLKSASTAMSVTDNFEFTMPCTMVFTILALLYLTLLAEKTTLKAPALKRRAGVVLLSVGFLFLMKTALCTTAFTDRVLTFSNLFTQWATYRDNGFVVSFIQNTKYLNIDQPKGYSAGQVAQDAREQAVMALKETQAGAAQPENPSSSPNVIVIMNEAFSDLSVLHEFGVTEDYMPYVHSLQQGAENTVTGNLFVSVVGGNTANTEFEFLTGDSLAFLPSGSVAYQQYISGELPSLASQLKQLGYDTAAVHPYLAGGWNRDTVYPMLGFENSYFKPDFKNPEIIRKYISDSSSYEKIIELYENKGADDPLFVFNVTMQNHSGYSEIFDNFPISVQLTDIENKTATENYLSLIQESDRAFQELVEYFSNVREDTIILMFGDHQPNDYVAECIASLTGTAKDQRSLEEAQNRFIVPFVMWANFDIEEETDVQLSVNYLSTLLLEAAGLPMTQYQRYLSRLSQTLPVITANVCIDSDGNYYAVSDTAAAEENPYQELLDQYWRFQYNHMFDTDSYPRQFFTLE